MGKNFTPFITPAEFYYSSWVLLLQFITPAEFYYSSWVLLLQFLDSGWGLLLQLLLQTYFENDIS
jgi:hypothetical protein